MRCRSNAPGVRWLAVGAATAAAVFGLVQGLTLVPDVSNRLRDDAFYEFTWAANVAAGHGPTVSDGVTTSGVQLLWSLCLVPVAWLGGPNTLPFFAPWLGFLLHCGAGVWLWLGSRDRIAGLCTGLCWLGNPLLVRECQNGQETALACLLLVALWLRRGAAESTFALLAVLAVLARSDLFGVVVALSLWRHRTAVWRAPLVPVLTLCVVGVANVWLGGGLLPDSASPMAWLWHENHALADPGGASWLLRSWWFLRPVLLGGPFALASAMGLGLLVFAVVRPWWPVSLRAVPALLVGCACALGARDLATAGWTALLLAFAPAAGRRRLPVALLMLLLGLLAIVVLHWAVRWYPRDYYVAPLVVGAAAALLHFGRWRLLLVVFALAQMLDWRRVQPEPLAGQREMELAGRCLDQVLPPGERVGCFNSGLVTFYADVVAPRERRHAIVNLDGVVDARAFAALQRRALDTWLDLQGVRFLLDNPVQFSLDPRQVHACGLHFGGGFDPAHDLVELARFDVPFVGNGRPGGDSMRLYWRAGRGAEPVRPTRSRDLGPDREGARMVLWPAKAGARLEAEATDGTRVPLLTVDADTAVVVRLEPRFFGTGRLFEAGGHAPVLVLRPL